MVLENRSKYKQNVAYELLIDGKYHYFGSHCRNRQFIYGSTIKANSGNHLARSVVSGELSRKEYNSRVQLINVWEFDSPEEALEMERQLIDLGKKEYGELCCNIMEGNNREPVCPEQLRNRHREIATRWSEKPDMKEFFRACGKKGVKNNPSLLRSKEVEQYDGDNLVARFPSISAAARFLGVDRSNLRKAAQGKVHKCCGFSWRFATDMGR